MPEIDNAVAPLFVSITVCAGDGVPTPVGGKLMVVGANIKTVSGEVGAVGGGTGAAGAVGVMPIEKFDGS